MSRYLIDSHVLLWWAQNPSKLSPSAHHALADGRSLVFVSAASIWELGIKEAKGKLRMPGDARTLIRECRFDELSITAEHAAMAVALPAHHKDPFDRLLIAQSKCEGLVFVTRDEQLSLYGAAILAA